MSAVGRRIGDGGRYEITQQLGAGGMGVVFLAHDTRLRSRVVVKTLAESFAANPNVRERFVNEALIQANLAHENIVRALDIADEDGRLAIVMEFVQGPSLEQLLHEAGGRLPLERALEIVVPVTKAISFAHARGVVHRDLKPGNILIDHASGAPVPRVVDFGIAKILTEAGQGMTREGSVLGTPAYMPPEQLQGVTDLDGRADVYALGAILYQLATGRLPFGAATEFESTYLVLSGQRPEPPSRLVRGLPPHFDAIVAKAMAFDREQRYRSADELRQDLIALANGQPPEHALGASNAPTVADATRQDPGPRPGYAAPPPVYPVTPPPAYPVTPPPVYPATPPPSAPSAPGIGAPAPAPRGPGRGIAIGVSAGVAGVAIAAVVALLLLRGGSGDGDAGATAGAAVVPVPAPSAPAPAPPPPAPSAACPCQPTASIPYDAACADPGAADKRVGKAHDQRGVELVREASKLKAQPEEARRIARQAVVEFLCALEASPANPRIWGDLGWAYHIAGDLVRARDAQAKLRQYSDNSKLLAASAYSVGALECAEGDWQGALRSYDESLALMPEGKPVAIRRAKRDEVAAKCP